MSGIESRQPTLDREPTRYSEYVKVTQINIPDNFLESTAYQDLTLLEQLWMDVVNRKPIGRFDFRMQSKEINGKPVMRILIGAITPEERGEIRALKASYNNALSSWIQDKRPAFTDIAEFKRQYV